MTASEVGVTLKDGYNGNLSSRDDKIIINITRMERNMIEKISNQLLEIIEDGEGVTTEFKEAKTGLPKNFNFIFSYI